MQKNEQKALLIGFLTSCGVHIAIFILLFMTLLSKNTGLNAFYADTVGTHISMEMVAAIVHEQHAAEPEAIVEEAEQPQAVITETVSDPTVKPKKKQRAKKDKSPKKTLQKKQPDTANDTPEVLSPFEANSIATTTSQSQTDTVLSGSGQAEADEIAAYKSRLHAEIERRKRYPQKAERAGRQGKVNIGFLVKENGSISNPHIIQSSGNNHLDYAALHAVREARPVGPRPKGMPEETGVLISFEIK